MEQVLKRKNRILFPTRIAWLLLAGLALVFQAVFLRLSLEGAYYSALLASSYPPLRAWLSYGGYILLVLTWRSLTMLAYWLAAVFIFWKVGRREWKDAFPGLFTSLLLALLPQLLFFNWDNIGVEQSVPWQAAWS